MEPSRQETTLGAFRHPPSGKLTTSMLKVLRNLDQGLRFDFGFAGGRSTSGGLWGVELGLKRRGLIDQRCQITDLGRETLVSLREVLVHPTPEGDMVATRDAPDLQWRVTYPWMAPQGRGFSLMASTSARAVRKVLKETADARAESLVIQADLLRETG